MNDRLCREHIALIAAAHPIVPESHRFDRFRRFCQPL
jgi:hypothetical protein